MPKLCKEIICVNPVFGGGYCKNHQYLRLDKTIKDFDRQPVNKISKKLRGLTKIYIELRNAFLKTNPKCSGHTKVVGCTGIATEIHHTQGRGKYLNAVWTWLGLCHNCHIWAENNPKLAKILKLSRSRL